MTWAKNGVLDGLVLGGESALVLALVLLPAGHFNCSTYS
jgi:hypothetical protein